MIELNNEIMREYLKMGLQRAYSFKERISEGNVKCLISEETNGDYIYQVIWMKDNRINNGVDFVQVMRKSSSYWSNWTHQLSKSLDFSVFDV